MGKDFGKYLDKDIIPIEQINERILDLELCS